MDHRTARPAPGVLFAERRTVPGWWWLVGLAIVLPTTDALLQGPEMSRHPSALLTWGTLAAAAALVAGCLVALGRSGVTVDSVGLTAGGSVLPANRVGRARALDATAARRLLGPGLRADAHLSLRPWIKTAVQIETDMSQRDEAGVSCPYWVVATRRPTELVAALDQMRSLLPTEMLPTEQLPTEQKASS